MGRLILFVNSGYKEVEKIAGKMYEFMLSIAGKVAASLPRSTSAVSESLQEVQDNAQEAARDLNDMSSSGLMEKLKGVGIAAAGITAAVGGMGGVLLGLVSNTAEAAKGIDKFSQVAGFSTEGFQEWVTI